MNIRNVLAGLIILLNFQVLASSASSKPASAPALRDHQNLSAQLEQWNKIPEDQVRTQPKATEPREEFFYNPLTRKNEKTAVQEKRIPLRHASPEYILEAVRPMMTLGIGRADLDREHAELVLLDKPANVQLLEKIVGVLDTPRPALVFKASPANVSTTKAQLEALRSNDGILIPVTNTIFVVRDNIENLLKMKQAQQTSRFAQRTGKTELEWQTNPRDFSKVPIQAPLRIEAPHGSEIVAVEQRGFPVLYANPTVALDAARKIVTRNLGKAHFDPATNLLIVVDRPETLLKFDAYLRVLDTAKPARLFKFPAGATKENRAKIQQRLSPTGEIHGFESDQILIVRDEENVLRSLQILDQTGRLVRPDVPKVPASQPIHQSIPASQLSGYVPPASAPAAP